MNIVNKLTLSHLKSSKKRTIVTIMGIIISVAMVTAVFTSSLSLMNFFKQTEEFYGGNWYSMFESVTMKDSKTLLSKDDVDAVSLQRCRSGVDVATEKSTAKSQTDFLEVNDTTYDMFNIKIKSGEFPKKSGDILVTANFIELNNLSWKVGETVKLKEKVADSAGKEKVVTNSYKICGITESKNAFTQAHSMLTVLDSNYKGSDLAAYVHNTKLDNSIWDTMKSDAKSISKPSATSYHNELFMYSGIIKDNAILVALGGFIAIILVIILVASVFMIYNSFAVSFQQRARYLGMLASVGATKRQKRSSIYFEGLVLGAIGIPLGILAGLGGMAVTFMGIGKIFTETLAIPTPIKLSVKFSWVVLLLSVVISALTIFISAFIPAHKASKTTAIEAIRQSNTVKVKSRKLKSSKLVGKLFGYEGQIAIKNYKRNGKRSRTITSALAISVILFLTVTSFSASFSQLFTSNYGGEMADVYVMASRKDSEKIEKKLDSIKEVDSYYSSASVSITAKNVDKYFSSDALKFKKEYDFSNFMIFTMSNSMFDKYCTKIGINSKDYYNTKDPKGILVNRTNMSHVDGKSKLTVEPFANSIKNQNISYSYLLDSSAENSKKGTATVNISAVTKEDITQESKYFEHSYIVMPYDTFYATMPNYVSTVAYSIKATDHKSVYKEIDDYMTNNSIENSSYDATEQMATMKSLLTIVNVFVYGFITLITLISVMNIINTISTSMEERRREFAMIKSVGLTPKGFKKMIYLESIYYGIKSLLWGIPISIGLNYLMYYFLSKSYDYGFTIHWIYYLISIVAVFLVIGIALIYSTSKIKNDNIIETLKSDDV